MEFKFSGEIFYWRGPAPFYFVTIPAKYSSEIKAISARVTYGWGVIPVTAKLGKQEWTTSLFPKDGNYLLPLKKVVRESAGLDVDDVATIKIEIDINV